MKSPATYAGDPRHHANDLAELRAENERLRAEVEALRSAVLSIHKRSRVPAMFFDHKGRHYCLHCTTSVDDYTAYVDWPCATAKAAGVDL